MMQNDYTITIGWGLGAFLWSLGFMKKGKETRSFKDGLWKITEYMK